MSLILIVGCMLIALALGYRFYGRFIAAQYDLDDTKVTPAHRHEDGVDFVPTRPFYLFGQHFSAIAAAGPIAGPILAAQQFGWGPCLLWIGLGVIFIGAVHDFSTLVASVRHDARSIAEVVRIHLGQRAWLSLMVFIWVALIYVIMAFTDLTAQTFVTGDAELAGLSFTFNPGGAIAAASVSYLALALLMGLVVRVLKPALWLTTLIFVPATFAAVYGGTLISTALVFEHQTWVLLILGYCFIASITPVWALLQPRGYLGGFVLYSTLAVGVLGLVFGGFTTEQPAFVAFQGMGTTGPLGFLFPFLFVTIACGACSGFHGLVCSGTTSKQIARETDCHPIGYGAMLLEGFVAVLALATLLVTDPSELAGKAPGAIFGAGLGRFLTVLIGDEARLFALTFGAMAFSTFVFDTIDVCTRLGRYALQELTGTSGRASGLISAAVTVGVPLFFLSFAAPGSYRLFWSIFGTSNQLLAGLSLLGITVWLKRTGRRHAYTLVPMIFVMAVTLSALVLQIHQAFFGVASGPVVVINGLVAVLLLALAVNLLREGFRAYRTPLSID